MRWARTVDRLPSAARLPQAPGVYRFRDQAGRVLYVGRAVSLRRRVLSYWGDLGERGHLAPMVARIAQVEAVVCDSAHEAAWLERNLLERRLPPWNRSPGGQEAEVWIRLSVQPRHPGLTVVRRPAPGDFGPYLGGQKARDAISGLGRVLPLAHAADGQAGAERDLARLRGASPCARAKLARAIAAVLRRDRDAVAALRAELTARRGAAAAALAFEFAGKLQAELEALDWITEEQKVTPGSLGPGRRRRIRLGGRHACLLRDPRRPHVRLAAAPLCGRRRPPLPGPVAARMGVLRRPQCRIGGPLALAACRIGGPAQGVPSRKAQGVPSRKAQGVPSRKAQGVPSRNLCWVKLYQLPESSRMMASTP